MTHIDLILCGEHGRIVTLLQKALEANEEFAIVGRYSRNVTSTIDYSLRQTAIPEAVNPTVVVDFTAPDSTRSALTQLAGNQWQFVIGTTGLSPADMALAERVAKCSAVVVASNYSIGMYILQQVVDKLAQATGGTWDSGIIDIHFRAKQETPSGTAKELLGRQRRSSAHEANDCQIVSLRLGTGVSEHRIIATSAHEFIEITHRILDRTAFIPGILRAIRFAAEASPGIYTFEDVLRAPSNHMDD